MFEFANNLINKKALKRALKEVDFEDALIQSVQSTSQEPVREYKTADEASLKKLKLNSALSKPETEAVDLKHFKDWRNVQKVESKNPPYTPKHSFVFDDDEDDGEQPAIENPVETNKKDLVSTIAANNKEIDTEEKKDTSIASFFAEKYKVEQDKDTKNVSNIKNAVKTSLNEILRNKRVSNNEDKVNKVEEDKKVLKVEVVDFSEKKPENKTKATTKKTTNRKPRGKNKRRFDADVISSVDWK